MQRSEIEEATVDILMIVEARVGWNSVLAYSTFA